MSDNDVNELNLLAHRYAKAVDACDVELFQSVFHLRGRLRSYHPDAEKPFADLIVHEQLAATATEEALLTAAHGLESVTPRPLQPRRSSPARRRLFGGAGYNDMVGRSASGSCCSC